MSLIQHNELTEVEQPFITQLTTLGWIHLPGDRDTPSLTRRSSFSEVILKDDLRQALHRINLRNDQPWLDHSRLSQAISALDRIRAPRLMEANQHATDLLLKGTVVDGLPDWDQGRSRTLHYIDWHHPNRNTFTVISQFRVDCPGGQTKGHIIPDLVLFINGIPVVVVECKSPASTEPMAEAIDQLRRYSNQRHEYQDNEGNEKLFHTNQFLIATDYDEARVGTICSDAEYYLEWKDTSPTPMAEVAAQLNKTTLSSQEKLIAGMLSPRNLLDLIRHFTLFTPISGRTVKIVSRYQQFRAVQKATQRLLTGQTRQQDGEHDHRGGIIWHTQGSGKSLTMVFLVRKMRTHPQLRRFKVVIITDRNDLQKQLSETADLTGESVLIANTTEDLKQLLIQPGPALVFGTIQKYQNRDRDDDDPPESSDPIDFPVLNQDEAILVLVDEAHRSHTNDLHAHLLHALPNCARIGFTGTPILMGAKRRTHEIFGEYIDLYTIRQSQEDGATVPILYEGRTAIGAVEGGQTLDQLFEDMFIDRTPEELEAIKRKYATKGNVLEAPALIEEKACDILHHYIDRILPNGHKAQVVAYSRLATIRYRAAFLKARDELVAAIASLPPDLLHLTDTQLQDHPPDLQLQIRAHRHLDLIRQLDFTPIISPGTNDDPSWKEWTERSKIDARIAQFKQPLHHTDPSKRSPLAFLIVKSMLLTGFDAPIEAVMYLDRPIKEAELLQAVARVNRTGHHKTAGIIVDYYGVAQHLKEALAAYSVEDVEGALQSLKDELPKLRDRHHRVIDLFTSRGIEDLNDTEACVELLRDERLRAEFTVKLKQFLTTLDLVLPRPEGLPYTRDAKLLSFIQTRARNRYREGLPILGRSIGEKVRQLIDDHLISLGIDPKIPPISILDADFNDYVARQISPRAKASEMEHAIRHHIRKRLEQDPVYYQTLSEQLEEILERFETAWDQQVTALEAFITQIQQGRQQDETGLDPTTQAPFLAILQREVAGEQQLTTEELTHLTEITVELVEHIQQEIRLVSFWRNSHAQEVLRNWIFQYLDEKDLIDFDRLDLLADQLMALAKANHPQLVRDDHPNR